MNYRLTIFIPGLKALHPSIIHITFFHILLHNTKELLKRIGINDCCHGGDGFPSLHLFQVLAGKVD
jgi:hypothetical protein